MLDRCFTFLAGVGTKTEERLAALGVRTWDDFLRTAAIAGVSPKRKLFYNRQLQLAERALAQHDLAFFAQRLLQREMWRLYLSFREHACFLDLEVGTDGSIIVLTLSDRFRSATLVRGMQLEQSAVQQELQRCKLLVTYNGSAFDIPKLEKFLGKRLAIPHFDLKPLCERLGLRGGLKDIERQLGIARPAHLRGSAADAWKAFLASGDKEYLELLVQYNEEDAVNLHQLAEKCLALLQRKNGEGGTLTPIQSRSAELKRFEPTTSA